MVLVETLAPDGEGVVLSQQLKVFGDNFLFPDTRAPVVPDPEPPSPWVSKQVRGMGIGQAKNVYAGLHSTGFDMPEARSAHRCGSCSNYSSASGSCLLVPMKFNGSVAMTKVTYPACSRFEEYGEDEKNTVPAISPWRGSKDGNK